MLSKVVSKKGKQSAQYQQNVKGLDGIIKFTGNIGEKKAKIQRPIEEKIKTVTVSKTPSGKYFPSILFEGEGENTTTTEGAIYAIDLGLKHFAVVTDGEKVFLYDNPKHLAKSEKTPKGQQQKLTQKKDDSNSRRKYRKVVGKVYVGVTGAWRLRVSNSRQDLLHKLSFMLVRDSQAGRGEAYALENYAPTNIGMLQADGTAVSAEGGEVRLQGGRKSVLSSSPMSSEAPTIASA